MSGAEDLDLEVIVEMTTGLMTETLIDVTTEDVMTTGYLIGGVIGDERTSTGCLTDEMNGSQIDEMSGGGMMTETGDHLDVEPLTDEMNPAMIG